MDFYTKKIILLLVSISFCFSALDAQSENVEIPASADELINPYSDDPKAFIKAMKVYKKVCWVCHGDNGKGDGPGAAELSTKPADFNAPLVLNQTDGALFWWISHGGNGMQPFHDVLTEEQIWNLVTYVRKVQGK